MGSKDVASLHEQLADVQLHLLSLNVDNLAPRQRERALQLHRHLHDAAWELSKLKEELV